MKFGKDPRQYSTTTKEFLDDGKGSLTGVNTVEVEWTKSPTGQWQMKEVPGSEKHHPADLILLAMGFLGPEKNVPTEIGKSRNELINGRVTNDLLVSPNRTSAG